MRKDTYEKITQEKLLSSERFFGQGILTEDFIDQSIDKVLKVEKNIQKLGDKFPHTSNNGQYVYSYG